VRLIQTVRGVGYALSHHVTFARASSTATVAAAAIAVILALFRLLLTTQFVDSLVMSHSTPEAPPSGGGHEISIRSVPRAPTGQTVLLPTGHGTFVENSRRRDDPGRRQGQEPAVYRTVAIGGNNYRELIVPIVAIQSGRARRQRLSDQDDVGRTVHHHIDGQVNELRNLVRT